MDHAVTVRGVAITLGGFMAGVGFGWAALTIAAASQSDSTSAVDAAVGDAKFFAGIGMFGLILIGAGIWA